MPQFLIVYGTTDGQTAKVSQFVAEVLRARGAGVTVVRAGTTDPDPAPYDGVLVAASIHVGGYQRPVVRWVRAHAEALNSMPTAFVSVCLGVLQNDLRVDRELSIIAHRFLVGTDWMPLRVKRVAGAVKYTQYGWLKRMAMRRIVAKAGGSTDVSRDHEYTDWQDVAKFAIAFFSLCENNNQLHGLMAATRTSTPLERTPVLT